MISYLLISYFIPIFASKQMNMETPFLYGRIAENENFTNRRNETEFLKKNFKGLINTVIISPRRWGKTSLVHKVAKLISEEEKNVIICPVSYTHLTLPTTPYV